MHAPTRAMTWRLHLGVVYPRGVVYQLGRFWKVNGPGLVLVAGDRASNVVLPLDLLRSLMGRTVPEAGLVPRAPATGTQA